MAVSTTFTQCAPETTKFNQSINQSINQSVTCMTAPLFVVKAASWRRRDESRNQLKATENR